MEEKPGAPPLDFSFAFDDKSFSDAELHIVENESMCPKRALPPEVLRVIDAVRFHVLYRTSAVFLFNIPQGEQQWSAPRIGDLTVRSPRNLLKIGCVFSRLQRKFTMTCCC